MIGKQDIILILKGTLLSILLFFSVSFLSVLSSISPFSRIGDCLDLKIGFPFTYYRLFSIDYGFQGGWIADKLLLDCLLYWVVITGFYFLIKRKKWLVVK